MIHVTCRLTAKNRDQLQNPTLGNRVWATFLPFLLEMASPGNQHCANGIGTLSFATGTRIVEASRYVQDRLRWVTATLFCSMLQIA